MSVIYIIMSQIVNNTDPKGQIRMTPQLIGPGNFTGFGNVRPTQENYLTFETAPRNTETVAAQDPNHTTFNNNLSYRHPVNNLSGTAYYSGSEINPMRSNFARPIANPYFLFFGKFCSQSIQNADPERVGHLDEANPASGVWQQPSNIYNIPDNPKDYVLIRNSLPTSAAGQTSYPDSYYDDPPTAYSGATHVVYDASSCPVNWRAYEPVRAKVTDWSNNGVPANFVNFKAGRYVLPSGASTFSYSTNPARRNVAGLYFNENQFDVSYNPTSQPNAYFELKPSFVSSLGSGGSGGTGTDLSFNNYFFKQPEMIPDCSAVFQSGGGGSGRDRLYIFWDLPFHRKTGQNVKQEGKRYFYEDGESPYESWLPHFSELVFDISGGQNNRKFCKDICGNFVHTGGHTASGSSATPFAILSANNRFISLEANTTAGSGSITNQWVSGGSFKHGANGQTTTIVDNFTPSSTNYAGGSPQAGDIGLGYMYDIALYYRNESKLNNPPGLASTDLYYNKHNPCIMKKIVFGVPGFISAPSSLKFFQENGSTGSGERYYLGGQGPATKDDKLVSNPGEGLNLVWGNTALIKVGYDCSLNFIRNSGSNRVQVGGVNGNTAIMQDFSLSNGGIFYDISYNLNITNGKPINMTSSGTNSPATLLHWPSGGNGNTPIWNAPDPAFDFIKLIDEIGNVPSTYSGSHPEHKYEAKHYHAVNDTEDPPNSGNLVRAVKAPLSTYLEDLIVPIFTRSVCNTTTESGYINTMTNEPSNWSSSAPASLTHFEFVDESTATPTTLAATTSQVRRRIGGNNEDVYFISGQTKLKFIAATPLHPYRQLANFGSAKPTPTAQTLAQLINNDAYIGTTAKNIKLGQVDFDLNQYASSSSITNLDNRSIDIYGWDASERLKVGNTNNPVGGKNSISTAYDMELGVGQTFDIAENETGFNNGYTNKEGYYLAFDISSCACKIDLSNNNFTDTALLGRVPGSSAGYNKYELELKHTLEKRGGGTDVKTKSIQIHVGEDISRNITVTNIVRDTQNIAQTGLKYFFGIRRLPDESIANGKFKGATNYTSGGTSTSFDHLEIHLKFQLNNISKRWMPPNTPAYGSNKLVELTFCVDPEGSSPLDLDENPGSATGNRFNVNWNDTHIIGSNPPSSTIFFNNSSSVERPYSENCPFFAEINEGQSVIVGTSGNGDGHYSRSVTQSGSGARPLLGLKDIDTTTSSSVGHIKFANNFKKVGWKPEYRDITATVGSDTGLSNNKYTFGTNNRELFWDYTFQVDTDGGKLPSRIISGKAQFDTDLILQNTNASSNALSTEFVLASQYVSTPSNYIFGSTNFELLNLEVILGGSGTLSTDAPFNHSQQLNSYQSMWCNTAFRGPVLTGQGLINDPYIDYAATSSSGYYGQQKQYATLGMNTSGLTLNGGGFVIHTDTNSSGGAGKPSGTPNSFTASGTYKVILLRINQGTSNLTKFNLKLRDINNTVMNLGSDYFLFYSEYHSGDTSAYTVRYAAAIPTNPGTRTSAFSGWLQPFTFGGFAANTIKTIEYSSGLVTGTRGSESGCADGSVNNWSDQQTNPSIECFNIGSNVSKFVAIYISEDKNIHRIELNKTT